jgi:hypothetical protein
VRLFRLICKRAEDQKHDNSRSQTGLIAGKSRRRLENHLCHQPN